MDLQANSASTRDWINASKNLRITAYDPGGGVGESAQSKPLIMAAPEPHPQFPLALQDDERAITD